ncbi:30S ribosomal protein S4 [bacterium]|nr:30S ribosomal protein S4 [bacterium]
MSRYTGPKTKISRRFGEDLSLKTNAAKTARRLAQAPGQHGAKMRRKMSQYGIQLKEKQKVRAIFGVSEKQLTRLYQEATTKDTNTGMTLLSFLERRLDNVLYRAGFAPTRAAARQLVNHAHFDVNGHKMDIPSYRVQVGDIVTVRKNSASIKVITDAIKDNDKTDLGWLKIKSGVIKVDSLPARENTTEHIDEQQIVEYYSR